MNDITLIEGSIHNPAEPRHFMEFQWPGTRYVARFGNDTVAESSRVLKLCEVARHVYEPMIYFPLDDVRTERLVATEKSTHCPLKGDTVYYDLVVEGGGEAAPVREAEIGWRYAKPFDFADKLKDYVAFDPRKVTLSAER